MQREIKFRGWNASSKLIVDNVMSLTKSSHLRSNHYSPSMGMIACDEVMQFTGLFDKNGKEIYEGDIITIYGYEMNYEIIFKSGCFGFEVINPINKISYNFATFKNIDQEYVDCEVLGNIFENPDLLK
jgi:uncharacterized phage protein (TIGR01671 family)